ncbi:hypothetical protein, partial [Neisseria sicca]|uniref:hypothetical protein n=1 Tax=Neisseria sicca TaxID=490 RepID=UPI003F68AD47
RGMEEVVFGDMVFGREGEGDGVGVGEGVEGVGGDQGVKIEGVGIGGVFEGCGWGEEVEGVWGFGLEGGKLGGGEVLGPVLVGGVGQG